MTTNQDRTAEVIADAIRPSMREFADGIGVDLAAVLADARVLAPDRPEDRPIEGMTVLYAVEHQHTPGGDWHQITGWSERWPFQPGHEPRDDERIIRRYATDPEVVE